MDVRVHPRVMWRHPELAEEDVLSAWRNAFAFSRREIPSDDQYAAVGVDANGRFIECVATRYTDGTFLIFHAMTPPSRKTLVEVGLRR